MKIGINIDPLLPSSCHYHRGIGTYTAGLINGLQEIDSENEYMLFYTSKRGGPLRIKENGNFRLRKRSIFSSFYLNNIIDYGLKDIDVLHFPSAEGPFAGKRIVVTAHDLIPLKYPKRFAPSLRRKIWNQTRYWVMRRAIKIIAVSENTKRDLIKYLHIEPDKIAVIYEGVEDIFSPKTDITKKYILASGSDWNKNTKTIIKAYNNLKSDIPLVINAIPDKELMAYIREKNLEGKVSFTGYLSRQEMVALYIGALVFVFPSIEEGFGLPLVEAMACGVPVIASTVSSLPEVVGSAGILVNPYDVSGIASALKEVLTNNSLRAVLSRKSLDRAKVFSWKKTALQTLELYKSIY